MEQFLPIFLILPFVGFIISALLPEKSERLISFILSFTSGAMIIMGGTYLFFWIYHSSGAINIKELTLFNSEHYKFFIDLYYDQVTATYQLMSGILTFLIAHFSRGYMHKDEGFKRFFTTMALYYFGIQVIIFSGNFETLFIGWEILGLSSFLLIAFYRNRHLPVRNGFKVFSMYRLADIGILLSMWLLHHLFHENITFQQLGDTNFVHQHTIEQSGVALIISLFIFLAAMVKSAQFPFSSWLPRAMEGPTPSSSIFYGSIAVHIGVYLLIRTYPFWSEILTAKICLIVIGVISTLVTSSIAQYQSSIKAQIAYSSLAQIGIMLIEIALGWESLVLIHMCGNAFLRSYQLLNSPSVATYLLRNQFFNLIPPKEVKRTPFQKRFKKTLFVLAINEYYTDSYIYKYLWFPFKRLGHRFSFFNRKIETGATIILLTAGIILYLSHRYESLEHHGYLPEIYASIGLIFVLRAFTIRKHPFEAWSLLIINHFWIAMAVAFNEHFSLWEVFYYLLGVCQAALFGIIILYLLAKKTRFSLDDYYGLVHEHKWSAFFFLLCCLALMGFPITTTFLGEDLMFSHIHQNQILLLTLIASNVMIAGISIMRIYSRIYLGPNHKWSAVSARRSA